MLREIKSSQRNVRHLACKVTGTGTAAINSGSSDFTLTDNGTGSYKLTLVNPSQRILAAHVQPIADAGDVVATLHTDTSALLVEVRLWDGTDGTTAKDGVFFLTVLVSDAADQT